MWVIAHRGACAVAPESTRAAILEAGRSGAQMIELDVQLTRDDRLVIFHDDRLERTTDGRGRVTQHRYAKLARLDAGGWFHPRFAGERILLASQAIRDVPKQMLINFELKATPRPEALLKQLLRLIRSTGARARLVISSFESALLRSLTKRHLALALISRNEPDRALRQAIRLGCVAWHPFRTLVTASRIRVAHAAGLRVHVWTVDEPAQARQLRRLGVDGIFTNDPASMCRALR